MQVLPPLNRVTDIFDVVSVTVISEDRNRRHLTNNFDSAEHSSEDLFGFEKELFPNERFSRIE